MHDKAELEFLLEFLHELEHVEVFWKQVGAHASIWGHLGASLGHLG